MPGNPLEDRVQRERGLRRAVLAGDDKGKLSELVSQMEHLTGKAQADTRVSAMRALGWITQREASGRNSYWGDHQRLLSDSIRPVVQGPMAERIRKALDRHLSVAAAHEATLGDIVDRLRKQHPDLIIQVKDPGRETKVILSSLTDVPLGAALQALEDSLTGYRIVVREYGLLIAPVADLPSGAVPLVEFWKGTGKDTAKKPR